MLHSAHVLIERIKTSIVWRIACELEVPARHLYLFVRRKTWSPTHNIPKITATFDKCITEPSYNHSSLTCPSLEGTRAVEVMHRLERQCQVLATKCIPSNRHNFHCQILMNNNHNLVCQADEITPTQGVCKQGPAENISGWRGRKTAGGSRETWQET